MTNCVFFEFCGKQATTIIKQGAKSYIGKPICKEHEEKRQQLMADEPK